MSILEINKNNEQDVTIFDSSSKPNFKPLGSSGTELFSGYFSEEYLQQLRGRRGAKVFDEIRRSETQVSMLLNSIMNPIKSGVWNIEEETSVEGSEKHKELIEFILKDSIDFDTFLHEALTFIIYGYSVFEIVNNVVFNHKKYGTFNGLKSIAYRSQKTIERWLVNKETKELEKIVQFVNGDFSNSGTMLEFSSIFSLIFTLNKEGDNWEGISALRPMYGPWFRKNLYLKLAAIGVEKSAIGTVIGTVPAGKQKSEEFEAFKNMLSNFSAHENAFLIKPEGWNIEIINNNFDPSKIKELIILENTEMINSLVANFLALGTNGGSGSYSLGTDLSDFFLSGIQSYADLICGVINRKLIPDLVKMNFGPQEKYPKLKASGITDKAGKELAEVIQILTGSNVIKPDMKLEDYLRESYKLPKADREELLNKATQTPVQQEIKFSDIKLSDKWNQKWNDNKSNIKEIMQNNLAIIKENYIKQIRSKFNKASASNKIQIANKLDGKGLNDYKSELKEALAEIANKSINDARKETPKAKNVKMSEYIRLAAPRGGYFQALPPNIKKIVEAQAQLIVNTQDADIQKAVTFQYYSSALASDNIDEIVTNINSVVDPMIDGSTSGGFSIDAAAGNVVSTVVNQARLDWFFEPEVLNTIESFTFFNEDPVSEICKALDGTTWAITDPDLDKYSPPLHHNCKSRLIPNLVGSRDNPEVSGTGSLTQKALDSISLCECSYNLSEKNKYVCDLSGYKFLSDLSPEDQLLISKKIAKLINEGKDQDQAVAIAYNMFSKGELG